MSRVKNYRVFKVYNWKGEPDYPPIARTKHGKVYVSWNGATEVKFWKLQGVYRDQNNEEEVEDIETIEKRGFESAFTIPKTTTKYAFFRVAALDGEKNTIKHSHKAEEAKSHKSRAGVIFGISASIGLALGALFLFRLRARRRREGKKEGSWELGSWGRYQYSRL